MPRIDRIRQVRPRRITADGPPLVSIDRFVAPSGLFRLVLQTCSASLRHRYFLPCRGGAQRVFARREHGVSSVHTVHKLHTANRRVFVTSPSDIATFVHMGEISENSCIRITGSFPATFDGRIKRRTPCSALSWTRAFIPRLGTAHLNRRKPKMKAAPCKPLHQPRCRMPPPA
jgi:hypothetical protein